MIALDPHSVLISDGDHKVLENLRFNVNLNGLQLADDNASPSASVVDDESIIAVPQLIWGKNHAVNFIKQYGKQDVIIATDCVYMTQSVTPLFETINEVLDDNTGIFLFVNTCASACSIETVFKIAKDAGFIALEEEYWYHEDDRDQRKHPVHVFRRRK